MGSTPATPTTEAKWFAGEQIQELTLRPDRYKAWLLRKFDCLPDDLRDLAVLKWLKLRQWHLAERKVWRALYVWTTRSTKHGQLSALSTLRDAYAARNVAYGEAIKAHWPVAQRMDRTNRHLWPSEVRDMLCRHPGWYSPRH